MDRVERPVSPHWQVYRWQVTNTLSILHRLTGLMLSLGLLVLSCWLIALASGPEAYADVQALFASAWFKLPLAGWAFCFFYHLANGIRHLVWDAGFGFEPGQIRLTGWVVVIAALLAASAYSAVAIL